MFFDSGALDIAVRGLALPVGAMLWVIVLTRIVGLRSFSKMTTFDFVMTVAMGSLMATASQTKDWGDFIQVLIAMAGLFAAQWGIARLRGMSERAGEAIQNTPVLLMRDGCIDEAALAETRVARADLVAKLREAGVASFSEVRAVVLETTGEISVISAEAMDPELLSGVREARRA